MRRGSVLAGVASLFVLASCGWVEESREAAKHEAAGLRALEAVERGDLETLRSILREDPKAANGKRWRSSSRKGGMRSLVDTALSVALRSRNAEAVEILLAAGADPNLELGSGEAPLEVLAGVGPHDDAALALAQALVARGARLAPRTDERTKVSVSPLLALLESSNPADPGDGLLRLYASDPAALRATDLRGRTPLHRAARGCEARTIEVLLESGADPNVRSVRAAEAFPTDRAADTPLHDAASCTSLGSIFALCAGGANPRLANEAGETPVDALKRIMTPEVRQSDTEAMRRGRASVVAALSPAGPCEDWYARFLRSGRPVSWEPVHAARYEFACGFGERFDCGQAGWAWHKGEGAAVDLEKAMTFYRKACDLGSDWACGMVGSLYDNGEGIPADPAEASRWFTKGCDGGDGQSCYRLGLLARDGRGVEADPARALALFEAGCARKYERACDAARAAR
jgi:hypothetical protein